MMLVEINAVPAAATHDILLETCESDGESHFQHWGFWIFTNPRALPQACSGCCAFGAKQMLVVRRGRLPD